MITYALVDPRNGIPRYVGRSTNPALRLKDHIYEGRHDTSWAELSSKVIWIGRLKAAGLKPLLVTLAHGDFEHLFFSMFRRQGIRLTNIMVPSNRRLLSFQPTEAGPSA